MKYKQITATGYVYDKRIFWFTIGITLLIIVGIAYKEEFNFKYKFYYECMDDFCTNPLMDLEIKNQFVDYDYETQCTETWCNEVFLARGVYGKKPPRILKYFSWIVFGLVFLGLLLNHLIHNRGKKPDLTLNLPEKWLNKLKNLEVK